MQFRKSSYSGRHNNNQCVEVGASVTTGSNGSTGRVVGIRDSKATRDGQHSGPVLMLTGDQARALLSDIMSGAFDL